MYVAHDTARVSAGGAPPSGRPDNARHDREGRPYGGRSCRLLERLIDGLVSKRDLVKNDAKTPRSSGRPWMREWLHRNQQIAVLRRSRSALFSRLRFSRSL